MEAVHLGEHMKERGVLEKGLMNLLQHIAREKQERLGPHHFQVALVIHILEKLRLVPQTKGQLLHELPVAIRALAFHHRHQAVRKLKFLLEAQ